MKFFFFLILLKKISNIDYCSNLNSTSPNECIFFSNSKNNCCFDEENQKCIFISKSKGNTNNKILCEKNYLYNINLIDESKKMKDEYCSFEYNGKIIYFNGTNEKIIKDYKVNGFILNCNLSQFLQIKILIMYLLILLMF